MTSKQKQIVRAWNRIEEANPDISTEMLFAMVGDETGADAGDIAIALAVASGNEGFE